MARSRVPTPATFVALVVVAMAVTAAGAGAGSDVAAPVPAPASSSICDTANCAKGNCSEVPGPVPVFPSSYKCTCDPGWSQLTNFNNNNNGSLLPCIIPNCTFSATCINTTLPIPGIPFTDFCGLVNCGNGGDCELGHGLFSYQCRCQPGFKNMLNDTSLPCIDGSCTFGPDCAKLGLVNTPDAPAPAPVGN